MIRAMMLAGATALALSGCAQLGQFTAADATEAQALATATGDTAVVPCYQEFAVYGNAIAGAMQLGILAGVEAKRSLQIVVQNPACSSIFAGILGELLKATPAAPFVP